MLRALRSSMVYYLVAGYIFIITLQAAYLVGLADPMSEPGCKGIIDQAQFSRANQVIQSACQTLSNPVTTQQQVSQHSCKQFLGHWISD